MLTTLLPYIPYIINGLPDQFLGFNLTGWAWMIMLLVTLFNLFFTRSISFPVIFWLPWLLYLVGYLVYNFSFFGLQLTLQYVLPLLIGFVASGFLFIEIEIEWLFKWFIRLSIFIIFMFIYGYVFKGGYTPAPGATPMLLTITFSLLCGLYYYTKDIKHILFAGIVFIVPVVDITRMGIAAMAAIFIFHFANTNIVNKIVFAILGLLVFFIIFNSRKFQEKTFYSGSGTIKELTINYYDNPNIRTSGRISWKKALEPGLEAAPIWGNGPRSDNIRLIEITGVKVGEAHNDYMSVRYNYGYVGLGLLLAGFFLTFISLLRLFLFADNQSYLWLITVSLMTLFISFLMFMYTDNILKYTIFFPNYFFALIGIVYSMKRNEDIGDYSLVQ